MDSIYFDYENVLIGRQKNIGTYNFFGHDPGGANEQQALSCIRYCIEKILKWDLPQALLKFDEYIIKAMKMDKLISYIDWPPEVDYGAPKYILSLLYPDKIKIDRQALVETTFLRVLSDEKNPQFPREYFTGPNGFYRFCVCLKYLIENYKTFSSLDELYKYFLSPEGKKFLYAYRLKVPADQFDISIPDCIHYITADQPDGELYYCYYSFLENVKRV